LRSEPQWFTTAPAGAIQKLYQKVGWSTKDVDLFEVNEAFAAVTMAAMKEFSLPHDIVNITAAPAHWAIRIGASGPGSSSRCWARCASGA
jgi:acetyl-CoA C-acetyltransferase